MRVRLTYGDAMVCPSRFAPTFATIALLAGCGTSDTEDLNSDYAQIMGAVLKTRPDVAAQREAWLSIVPHERDRVEDFLDHRICIVPETRDEGTDVGIEKWLAGQDDARFMEMPISLERTPAQIDEEGRRLGRQILPGHLRSDSVFTSCPSGIIRFGNPRIARDRAYVFYDLTSRRGGGKWVIRLKRRPQGWMVVGESQFVL